MINGYDGVKSFFENCGFERNKLLFPVNYIVHFEIKKCSNTENFDINSIQPYHMAHIIWSISHGPYEDGLCISRIALDHKNIELKTVTTCYVILLYNKKVLEWKLILPCHMILHGPCELQSIRM